MSTKKDVYENFETLVQHIHLTWALNKHVTIGDLAQATGLQYPTVQKILRHPLYKSAFVRHPLHGIILSGLDPDGIDVSEICRRAEIQAIPVPEQPAQQKGRKVLGGGSSTANKPVQYKAHYVNTVDPTVDFEAVLLSKLDKLAADPKDKDAWYYVRNRVGFLIAHLERAKGSIKSIDDPTKLTIFTDSPAVSQPQPESTPQIPTSTNDTDDDKEEAEARARAAKLVELIKPMVKATKYNRLKFSELKELLDEAGKVEWLTFAPQQAFRVMAWKEYDLYIDKNNKEVKISRHPETINPPTNADLTGGQE